MSDGQLGNNVISISDLRKLSHKEANDMVSRAVLNHWPQYKIDFYKDILLRYSQAHSVSPQQLYDQIMQPEITAKIRDHQARHGVALSVVEARPNQGDNGRDLIRKWLHHPHGKVARGFLKYVRRFVIIQKAELREFLVASHAVLENRRQYHSTSLHDISQADLLRGRLRELLKPNETYCFLLEEEQSVFATADRKLLVLQFHESGIGYFLIYALPKSPMDGQSAGELVLTKEGLELEYQGYLWAPQPSLDTPEDEVELQVVFARKLSKTTTMPPCKPYLLSRQISLKLISDTTSNDASQIAVSKHFLTGGKLDISSASLPEMYQMEPRKIAPKSMDILKKLEGIQINV